MRRSIATPPARRARRRTPAVPSAPARRVRLRGLATAVKKIPRRSSSNKTATRRRARPAPSARARLRPCPAAMAHHAQARWPLLCEHGEPAARRRTSPRASAIPCPTATDRWAAPRSSSTRSCGRTRQCDSVRLHWMGGRTWPRRSAPPVRRAAAPRQRRRRACWQLVQQEVGEVGAQRRRIPCGVLTAYDRNTSGQ